MAVAPRMPTKGTMREIDLQEHATSDALTLSVEERDALARKELNLSIAPVPGTANEYTLTPGSVVGAVETVGLSVRIAPKIGICQLLSLACYAIDKAKLQEPEFDFPGTRGAAGCPGAGVRRSGPPGIFARAAPRLSHRGGCAARGAGAHPIRRPDPPQVWHPRCRSRCATTSSLTTSS